MHPTVQAIAAQFLRRAPGQQHRLDRLTHRIGPSWTALAEQNGSVCTSASWNDDERGFHQSWATSTSAARRCAARNKLRHVCSQDESGPGNAYGIPHHVMRGNSMTHDHQAVHSWQDQRGITPMNDLRLHSSSRAANGSGGGSGIHGTNRHMM